MVRKISGKQLNSTGQHMTKPDSSKSREAADVANLFADEFESNSSSNQYSQAFQTFQYTVEKQKVNFTSDNSEDYSSRFNITEPRIALERSNATATGPDEVYYQFLKHLPDNSLLVLLDIFNGIWENGSFPAAWREAIIIPIAKPGKDPTKASKLVASARLLNE
ncbi:hypothetical protein HOLleu_05649 [Holothuria leucospilota]|uniref:Uncharacterized protein n=1 Tax=Holothuria leucospilota TaxID=206669 RepID=A0A9Q1CL18_HOLLE|nr:hypothetical protein HOLleu_05649 [Holothuria leucospilota]